MGSYQNGSRGDMVGRCGLGASGPGYGPVAGSCEHGNGNETSVSIKGGEFLD
jgi:hypothetical protein